MQLGIVMLDSNSTLNNLRYLREVTINPGDTAVIMFQLIDLDTISQNDLVGTRYMPIVGATMTAVIPSINDFYTINAVPTMSFPNDDRSIWQIPLSSNQTQNAAGCNINIVLTEGTKISSAVGKNILFFNPSSEYCC